MSPGSTLLIDILVEQKNTGYISVDRSHCATFKTYNARIHKCSRGAVHKHMRI